ncbi:MAG TPA: hypothetical protein VHG52_14560, partial [Thermomicrobiales bacterium]|nr:hypothetical protein [Thermomicrobiales bacterium]
SLGASATGSAAGGGSSSIAISESSSTDRLYAALGILEVVAAYNLSVLDDSDIAIELLPPPAAEPVAEAPSDINTGGEAPSAVTTGDATIEEATTGETSTISMEPGSGAAPATGSTGAAAPDGIGATNNGDNQPRQNDGGNGYEAPGG